MNYVPIGCVAAVFLRDLSVGGIALFALNMVIGIAVGVTAWSVRRLVRQNDEGHGQLDAKIDKGNEQLDSRIDKLTGAIEAERESRHKSFHELNERAWHVNSDLKENYQTRHEGMRLYGALSRKIDGHHRELMAEVKDLPCKQATCPTEKT